jgi:hypothetical protein
MLRAKGQQANITSMIAALETDMSNGRITISFPESAVSPEAREDFLTFLKDEWILRQSQLTSEAAKVLAEQVDGAWWASRKESILSRIGEG